jgi:hypothetical protein
VTTKKPAGETDAAPASPATSDIALVHGVTADGEGLHILRARDNRIEFGAIRPLREGVPIRGEVVTLRPREDFPALCDVETRFVPPALPSDRQESPRLSPPRTGPAQVATEDYRRNWDAIWSHGNAKTKLAN